MKPPIYYRLAITLSKPLYRMVLSFSSEKREKSCIVTQADEFAMRYMRKMPKMRTSNNGNNPCIWIHATSLSETNSIAPVIKMLLARGYEVLITNTTHTGYAYTKKLFVDNNIRDDDKDNSLPCIIHTLLPIDSPKQIQKFLAHYQPQLAIFVETVLWANMVYALKSNNIPSILANARLSQGSFKYYQKFAKISQSMMHNISHIICQDNQSEILFQQLGANKKQTCIAKPLKYAVSMPEKTLSDAKKMQNDWQLSLRKVVVVGNSHDIEEAMILAVYTELVKIHKDLLLIIAPYQPERLDTVAELIIQKGYSLYRSSANDDIEENTQVYLVDSSMHELSTWYALADIVLVAGSFVLTDIGGHNPIEACLLGKPVIMGQYTNKCQYVINDLLQHNAINVATDHQKLYEVLDIWLSDDDISKKIGENGKKLAESNKDTAEEQLMHIEPYLPKLNIWIK